MTSVVLRQASARLRAAAVVVALLAGPAVALVPDAAAAADTSSPDAPAAADTSSPVSWSVTPSDESGPDGRTVIKHELDPGESVEDRVAVRNLGAESIEFLLSAADGYYNAKGRFDMLPSGEESVAAGTWVSLPDSVTVDPGETKVVPFVITVPDDAEPGDHAAGVAASIVTVSDEGGGVGVESRVGVKVLTRVTGELTPAFTVSRLSADYRLSWNPFRPGKLTTTFEVRNTGNTALEIAGVLDVAGRRAQFPAEGRGQQLLPGESRSMHISLARVWPLFVFPGSLTLSPTANGADGANSEVTPVSASLVAWAMPWPQLLMAVGIALIVVAVRWNRVGRVRKLRLLLEQAREQGRAEATGR